MSINEWVMVKVPAWIRHPVAIFVGTYLLILLGAIVSAKGVTGVDWALSSTESLDGAAYATAGGFIALYLTPLTNAYGVAKDVEEVPTAELDDITEEEEDSVSDAGELTLGDKGTLS